MVLDTSALLAVLFDEAERERLTGVLANVDDVLISGATLVEASIVMRVKAGEDGVLDCRSAATGDEFVRAVAPARLCATTSISGKASPRDSRMTIASRHHHHI